LEGGRCWWVVREFAVKVKRKKASARQFKPEELEVMSKERRDGSDIAENIPALLRMRRTPPTCGGVDSSSSSGDVL